MPVTQQDVADKLGISRRTVSYALNGSGRVGPDLRERIQVVAEEMGYHPNRAAQTLVTGRTNQIALCIPSLNNPFHIEIVRHVEAFTRNTPYDLLVTTMSRAYSLSQLVVDGIIWHHSNRLLDQGISCPMVVLQAPPSHFNSMPEKSYDEVWLGVTEASNEVMDRLLSASGKGSRIAFVNMEEMMGEAEPRWCAYRQAMEHRGLPLETVRLPYHENGALSVRTHVQLGLTEYFLKKGFPDALFCLSDDIAIGAYRALRDLGRRIPEETQLVGCDDLPEVLELSPPMTSIRHSWEDICFSAWEMLTSRIQNPELPTRKVTFESKLICRGSTI
jgi:DNA-binding LacI/PurR family transcriptional regulator